MAGRVRTPPVGHGVEALMGFREVAAALGPRSPDPGDRAVGHGVSGEIVAVPEQQPLAADGIWRVALAGEPFGRLVGRRRNGVGAWRLLQLDDLTDAQLDAYEAARLDPPRPALLTTS